MIRAPWSDACRIACAASVMDSSEVAGNLRLASAIRNGSTGFFNLPQIGVGVADPRLVAGFEFVVALPAGRGSVFSY